MADQVELEIIAIDAASDILGGIADKLLELGRIAVEAFKAVTEAGMEQQDTMTRFNTLVAASPFSAMRDQLLQIADSQSQVTKASRDSIIAAEGQLTAFTNISQTVMPDVVAATLDMAEKWQIDAPQAANKLGKALADIANGSLRTLFMSKEITAAQRDQAVAMAKAGDEAGAQAYIVGILNDKYGTLAETMGTTVSGQITIAQNAFHDMLETIGNNGILPLLEPLVKGFTDFAHSLGDLINKGASFRQIFDFIRLSIADIDWAGMSQDIINGLNSIDWNAVGQEVGFLLNEALSTAIDIAKQIDWIGIFTAFNNAFFNFIIGLAKYDAPFKQQLWNIVVAGVNLVTNAAKGLLLSFIGDIVGILEGVKKAFFNAFQGAMQQAIQAIKGMTRQVLKAAQDFMDLLKGIVHSFAITIGVNFALPKVVGAPVGGGSGAGGSSTKTKATGGYLGAGQSSTIGEEGPELFTPSTGGYVTPSNRRGSSGNAPVIVINLSYAPMFSTADRAELVTALGPVFDELYRYRLSS